jgi:hypothetical protein
MGDSIKHQLAAYLSHCSEISTSANYWFFRTQGGQLYNAFITSQSIAIGYPTVELKTLMSLGFNDESKNLLTRQIRKTIPEEQRPGLAAGQLLIFSHQMKEGDYVIIPSWGSHQLAIGVIRDNNPFEKKLSYEGKSFEGFEKQRRVKWLKWVSRESVNPNLFKMLYAHQTVTNVNACAQWIDVLISDFFKKGDEYHFVLEINETNGINARNLFESSLDLFALVDAFAADIGVNEDSRGIDAKINLNSPGTMELIAKLPLYMMAAGLFMVALNGGGLKAKMEKFGINFDFKTDGLIKAISKWLNDKKNRQLADTVEQKLKDLKVENPADILRLLEVINKRKP